MASLHGVFRRKPRGFGRLPAQDQRDRLYATRSFARRPEAARKTWRTGAVLDQAATSSCVGHAWRALLDAAPLRTRLGPDPYLIYAAAQGVDEWPGAEPDYQGTSVRAGAKVLADAGHVAQYLWASSAREVADWILAKGPVVMGTNWYEGMTRVGARGRVHVDGEVEGGHAYLLYAFDENAATFHGQNSWGRLWGRLGRFSIGFDDVQRLVREDGEACTAVETPLVPKQTSTPPPVAGT